MKTGYISMEMLLTNRRPVSDAAGSDCWNQLTYLGGHYNLLLALASSSIFLQSHLFRANVLQSPT